MVKMRPNRRAFLGKAGLVGTGLIAGCMGGDGGNNDGGGGDGGGGDGGDGGDNSGSESVSFTIQAAAEGTTYYALTAPLSETLRQNSESPKLQPTVSTTGGGTQNMRALGQQSTDIAMAVSAATYGAYHGNEPYKQKWDVRPIARADAYPMFHVVREDSDIETIEDLEGKSVSAGPSGSGALSIHEAIMELLGISIERKKLEHGEGGRALQDGKLDAWWVFVGPDVRKTFSTADVRTIGFTEDQMSKILEERPWHSSITMNSDWIEQIQGEHLNPGVNPMWCAHKDYRTDVVKEFCRVLFEHTEPVERARSNPEPLTPEFAVYQDGFDVPYHKGAQEYYEEAGVL